METGVHKPSEGQAFADFGEDRSSRWANIVRRFGPPLRGYFANRVRNSDDIDDLVQAVFLQLLQRADGGPIEHVQQYIFQVANNVLRDQGRRRKVRHHDFHDAYDDALHGREDGIPLEREVIACDELSRVLGVVRELPDRTREVFFLRGVRQCTHEEVATMLGISVRAVHKHMARVYKHIGRVFGDQS